MKLPRRRASGLLKLHIIKHFRGEQCSGCKDQQLVPCLTAHPPPPFSGEHLVIRQNPTRVSVTALFQPPCCSPGLLVCVVVVLYKYFSRKSHFPLCSYRQSVCIGVNLLHRIMGPGVHFIFMV